MIFSHITATDSAFVHYFSFFPNTHTDTHTLRGVSDRIDRCTHAEQVAT